ncbi:MAG: NHL repeat-containing protein [Planctomycetota bacterium]
MKTDHFFLYSCVSVVCAIWVTCVFCGCQQAEVKPIVEEEKIEPVFFPPFPDKPRLQFLTSFSSLEENVGDAAKPGWFEEFVVGTVEEQKQALIAKPYGMAVYDGKLYVCDTARGVLVFDIKYKTHSYLTNDRRLSNPVSIWIDSGNKYITDPKAPGIFVFDKSNRLTAIFGRDSGIVPLGVAVWGQRCYVTDQKSKQVIVLDKVTGEEINRVGKRIPDGMGLLGDEKAQFRLIGDVTVDQEGNLYVTDRVTAQISKFDSEGTFLRTFGQRGVNIAGFVRPKGVAIDRENRIWVVDAGTHVCKIYNDEGRLLLYFGMVGNRPGMMYVPATVTIDYDNVDLFQEYAVDGAKLEFLVIVTNQYGSHKVSVFGFGSFPLQEKEIEDAKKRGLIDDTDQQEKAETSPDSGMKEQ